MYTLDELLERDKKREKDGFKRKIKMGKIVKPQAQKDKITVVPVTEEEKFIHDDISNYDQESSEEDSMGGTGEGEEGDVLGEQPIDEEGEDGDGEGPGEGSGGEHEIESEAYELGKTLTEDFELPNLQNKGKKKVLSTYNYDLTDKNRGVGQILDKKATLKKIVETNLTLGNIKDIDNIDSSKFIVSPSDKIYRILSREKQYESQAVVFFLRDYSGSMSGKVTQAVVSQHVMLYSWLLYQYNNRVETRFILHDTEAKEVPDFNKYFSYKVAGGTKVSTGFKLANDIIENEGLARDNNIYFFHGTDGDDWDANGENTIKELNKSLSYISRIGITIVEHNYNATNQTTVEKYLKKSELLTKYPSYIKLDVMGEDSTDTRHIDGIKKLIG